MIINSTSKSQPGAWGDFIGKLWVSEYIKTHKPDWEILFDDVVNVGKISDNIKIPWATITDNFMETTFTGEYIDLITFQPFKIESISFVQQFREFLRLMLTESVTVQE